MYHFCELVSWINMANGDGMKNKFYEAWNATQHRENSVHIHSARDGSCNLEKVRGLQNDSILLSHFADLLTFSRLQEGIIQKVCHSMNAKFLTSPHPYVSQKDNRLLDIKQYLTLAWETPPSLVSDVLMDD